MGNSVRDIDVKTGRQRGKDEYRKFQPDETVSQAHRYPTNLSSLSTATFDRIARHGFECTDATLAAHRPDLVSKCIEWSCLEQEATNGI